MRLSTLATFGLVFGGAAAGAYLAAGAAVGALESNSREGVAFELRVAGHDWAQIQADGLQVVLSGVAPTEAERFRAIAVAGRVVDTARVIDNISVEEAAVIAAPTFTVEMLRNDAGISLIGLIPAATDRAAMLARLARDAGDQDIADFLEAAEYDAPDGWDEALSFGMQALGDLPRSKVSVSAERVDIIAAAESAGDGDRIKSALSRQAPDGVRVAVEITAPRPVITPFTLRFLIDEDGASFDVCSAASEAGIARILTAATDAGFEGKAECRLGLGSPSDGWAEAAAASIAAVEAIGQATVTLSDLDVSLVAALGTDPQAFATAQANLLAALPEEFALSAVLPAPEATVEEGAPEFVATRSPEGQVQMRGHVGDALALAAVDTFAQSRFGADQAVLAPRDHAGLPAGWQLRTLAGLAALAELNHGSVTVEAASLEVRGVTGDRNSSTRIAEILQSELGEGQAFTLNVRYDELLDPLASIPTPEECLADILAVTDAQKLTFEPGSGDLDGDSLRAVTAIADILKECPEFDLTIEGHTDSQGRESMNLALSQERAEAVLEALRGERVSWLTIVPKGFGEANPIADNGTEDGREANRRIAFTMAADADAPVEDDASAAEDGAAETAEEEPSE
ncbi:MAG: OmpA family protein [Pseudomonadota bacterium]